MPANVFDELFYNFLSNLQKYLQNEVLQASHRFGVVELSEWPNCKRMLDMNAENGGNLLHKFQVPEYNIVVGLIFLHVLARVRIISTDGRAVPTFDQCDAAAILPSSCWVRVFAYDWQMPLSKLNLWESMQYVLCICESHIKQNPRLVEASSRAGIEFLAMVVQADERELVKAVGMRYSLLLA